MVCRLSQGVKQAQPNKQVVTDGDRLGHYFPHPVRLPVTSSGGKSGAIGNGDRVDTSTARRVNGPVIVLRHRFARARRMGNLAWSVSPTASLFTGTLRDSVAPRLRRQRDGARGVCILSRTWSSFESFSAFSRLGLLTPPYAKQCTT